MQHDDHQRALARAARDLFEDFFAKPYLESGRVGPVGPVRGTPEEWRLALTVHDFLRRRGLTVTAGSNSVYRISDLGKDLAGRPQEVDRILGVDSGPETQGGTLGSFNPIAVKVRAKEIFQLCFMDCRPDRWWTPDDDADPSERAGLEELARHGLVRKANGGFALGERGVEVCMGELDLDTVLGLSSGVTAAPTTGGTHQQAAGAAPMIVVNNYGQAGSIGLVASTSGSTFIGGSANRSPEKPS